MITEEQLNYWGTLAKKMMADKKTGENAFAMAEAADLLIEEVRRLSNPENKQHLERLFPQPVVMRKEMKETVERERREHGTP